MTTLHLSKEEHIRRLQDKCADHYNVLCKYRQCCQDALRSLNNNRDPSRAILYLEEALDHEKNF